MWVPPLWCMGASQLKVSDEHKTIRSCDCITRVVGQDYIYNKKYFCYKRFLYEHGENRPSFPSHWQEFGRVELGGENLNKWMTKCMVLWIQKYSWRVARSPWPWWTMLRSNRHTSGKEAQASFLLFSWSTPYQLEHTYIPHSMLTNIHRISSQIPDYSTSIIWKYGLYLICPGTETTGTFCWSLMEICFTLGVSLTKLAVYCHHSSKWKRNGT